MNIVINSQALAQELRLINKIVPTKATLPILTHVLLASQNSTHLSFYATDLEVGLSTQCQAEVRVPGTVALPAKKLSDMCEQFPDGDVEITLETDPSTQRSHARVVCGAFKSRLQALPASEFPFQPPVVGTATTLDGPNFRTLIARTRYAITDKPTKYVLNGSLLTLTPTGAAMVATDSKRLSLATMPYAGDESSSVVIPSKTLDVLAQGDEPSLAFSQGPRHLFFQAGVRLLISRMVEGTFPAYSRIIPRENDKQAVISRSAWAAALRRVISVSEENFAVVMAFETGVLSLSARSPAVGDAAEQVQARYSGLNLNICVNGQFVLDFLGAATNPEVTVSVKDAHGAMLLTDGEDFLNVVIAMKM